MEFNLRKPVDIIFSKSHGLESSLLNCNYEAAFGLLKLTCEGRLPNDDDEEEIEYIHSKGLETFVPLKIPACAIHQYFMPLGHRVPLLSIHDHA